MFGLFGIVDIVTMEELQSFTVKTEMVLTELLAFKKVQPTDLQASL